MIAQTFSYPIEVIRKHMQVSLHQDHSTILKTTVDIYKQRGLRGFFAGLTIGYVKVTPMFAVSFYTYEYMKSVMSLA